MSGAENEKIFTEKITSRKIEMRGGQKKSED